MIFPRLLFLVLALAVPLHAMAASVDFSFKDSFSHEQRQQLEAWIADTAAHLEVLVGTLPFTPEARFHKTRSSEPVPWASTNKRYGPRVNFHVDPRHTAADFRSDWTASHELIHLMFPYLGDQGRWFAEGIASYLQYQVMYAGDVLSWEQVIRRYRDRFQTASGNAGHGRSIAALSPVVGRHGAYVRLYWGGAAYFLEVDRRLHEEKGLRLNQVIQSYLECCFGQRRSVDGLISQLDRISDSDIFQTTRAASVDQLGFPDWREGLAWLAAHPPGV